MDYCKRFFDASNEYVNLRVNLQLWLMFWTIFQYHFLFSIMLKFACDTLNLFVRNEKGIRI